MIASILVLGGGSAGFLAAITLKRILPHLAVTLVRSPEIGIIGVGEGTTPFFPLHLHRFLGLPPRDFYERAQPTWKLGIRFLWGSRGDFSYTFDRQFSTRFPELPRNNGFYAEEDIDDLSPYASMMAQDKAFGRDAGGRPLIPLDRHAYHIENVKLVAYLEWQARQLGVVVEDGTVARVERTNDGRVRALALADGRTLAADFFVDASGFRSVLLGGEMGEGFVDYSASLFCDRAVIAPWERGADEVVRPYTTAETMDHGWCWRIDHENHVNRGYVYASDHVSDAEAEAEFRRKNPRAGDSRIVRFRSGRYQRSWVGNVVAVGNAAGFVEPLEATALMILCGQCRMLAESLLDSLGEPGSRLADAYNRFMGQRWDEIRDFLAVHYRFNGLRDTPFWQRCRQETPLLGAADLVAFYEENGPSLLANSIFLSPHDQFGMEGYLAMLVGMKVPHRKPHHAENPEREALSERKRRNREFAAAGIGVAEAWRMLRDPRWVWT
jgi:tryptophan halogenase